MQQRAGGAEEELGVGVGRAVRSHQVAVGGQVQRSHPALGVVAFRDDVCHPARQSVQGSGRRLIVLTHVTSMTRPQVAGTVAVMTDKRDPPDHSPAGLLRLSAPGPSVLGTALTEGQAG